MNKKIIIFFLIFILSFLVFLPSAKAQSLDIGIYPPVFEVQTTPPASVKVPFFIQNFSDDSIQLYISLKPFISDTTENGQIEFTDSSSLADPDIAEKIHVIDSNTQISTIILSPKQKKNLNLQVEIPNNQPKGDYYFSIVFSTATPSISNLSFSQNSAGISSNILLSVGPLGKNQGFLQDFSSPHFVTKGPIPFTVRIKNTSDHFITPKGNILIENMFGQTVGKIDLLPVNILSGSIRRIPDSVQSGSAKQKDYDKIKDLVLKNNFPVSIWPEKFLLGPYKATLTISLSESGPQFKKQIVFFALPAEYMLGILIIFTIILFVTIRVRKIINSRTK